MSERVGDSPPELSVIIVTWNSMNVIRECLKCLYTTISDIHAEIIVVDNQSTDGTPDLIKSDFPMVNLIRSPENRGFTGGNNLGFSIASGRFVLLLNPDAFLNRGGDLRGLLDYMGAHPEIGVLGGQQYSADGSPQKSFDNLALENFILPNYLCKLLRRISGPGPNGSSSDPFDVGYVFGAFLLTRKDIIITVSGFDENFFAYFEEIDLCRRIHTLGMRIVYLKGFPYTHLGKDSFGQLSDDGLLIYSRSMYYFVEKHYGCFFRRWLQVRLIFRYGLKVAFYSLFNLKRPGSARLKKYRALLKAQFN